MKHCGILLYACLLQFGHQTLNCLFARVTSEPRDKVGSAPSLEHLAAEDIQPERNRFQRLLKVRLEFGPVAGMLFRPEEVHPCSAKRAAVGRTANLAIRITDQRVRLHAQHLLVSHFNNNGFSTVQTRCLDPDGLTWKEPANRQRLKASLGEPLLLAVDRNPVLGRLVVEGRKRGNIIRLGVQPAGHAGIHQISKNLTSVL